MDNKKNNTTEMFFDLTLGDDNNLVEVLKEYDLNSVLDDASNQSTTEATETATVNINPVMETESEQAPVAVETTIETVTLDLTQADTSTIVADETGQKSVTEEKPASILQVVEQEFEEAPDKLSELEAVVEVATEATPIQGEQQLHKTGSFLFNLADLDLNQTSEGTSNTSVVTDNDVALEEEVVPEETIDVSPFISALKETTDMQDDTTVDPIITATESEAVETNITPEAVHVEHQDIFNDVSTADLNNDDTATTTSLVEENDLDELLKKLDAISEMEIFSSVRPEKEELNTTVDSFEEANNVPSENMITDEVQTEFTAPTADDDQIVLDQAIHTIQSTVKVADEQLAENNNTIDSIVENIVVTEPTGTESNLSTEEVTSVDLAMNLADINSQVIDTSDSGIQQVSKTALEVNDGDFNSFEIPAMQIVTPSDNQVAVEEPTIMTEPVVIEEEVVVPEPPVISLTTNELEQTAEFANELLAQAIQAPTPATEQVATPLNDSVVLSDEEPTKEVILDKIPVETVSTTHVIPETHEPVEQGPVATPQKKNTFLIRAIIGLIVYYVTMFTSLVSTILIRPIISIPFVKDWILGASSSEQMALTYLNIFAQNIIYLFLFIVFIALFLPELKKSFKALKQKWIFLVLIPLAYFVLMVFNVIIMSVISQLVSLPDTSQNQEAINSMMQVSPFANVFPTIFAAPLVEEIVFRLILAGGIFTGLSKLLNKDEKATKKLPIIMLSILVSGVLFGLLHVVSNGDFLAVFPYVIMGIGFTTYYFMSDRNIIVVIGLHMFLNIMATLVNLLLN